MSAPFISMPTSACFASVAMTLKRAVGTTVSPFTFMEQAFKWPGEIWAMDLVMPPFTSRAIASDWIAFLAKLEGMYGRFLAGDPSAKVPRGVATGTPLVDLGGQSGNILNTKGWTPNVTGIMLKGDYFQLGTGVDSRLYMITADIDTDSSGDAILEFVPALRTPPNDGAPLVVNDAKGMFRINTNDLTWEVLPGPIYRLGFVAVEVINA